MSTVKTIIFTRQNSRASLLESIISEVEGISFLASTDDCVKAINAVSELKKAIFIADMSEYEDEILNMVLKISSQNEDIKIIALSEKVDTSTTIKAMRAGVSEIIRLPIVKDKFVKSLKNIIGISTGQVVKQKKCKTLSVFSNKGGVGKTSIAMNLALELAKTTRENVALLDLNFQLGDVATFWNLNPTYNISYMIENNERLTPEFMLSTFEKWGDSSLYILANPPFYKSADRISVEGIERLIKSMQEAFSYIVIDTSTGFGTKVMKALELSDIVFFITTVSLPSLRNCQKCLEMFKEAGISADKTEIIINRYMETDDVKIEDVETLLKKKIFFKIPNNYFIITDAINRGVPVSDVNSMSNVAKSYRNLALSVTDSVYKL